MRNKNLYFILLILFISTSLVAQIDNNKAIKTDAFNFEPEKKSDEKKIVFDNSNTVEKKGETITRFGNLSDISDNFPQYSVVPNKKNNNMQNHSASDKDVLVKKYWNGKDISDVKLKTKLELGKLETSTQRIRIECRDHSYVDGDRVRLYVNEQVIRSNIILHGGYYSVDIDLKEGFNRIDIEALNQGTSGPNTAEFRVFDDQGNLLADQEWNILTGYVATLVVIKK
ncbi:MAG: hypothetical protein GQ552_08515 [Flavobacteriaceae bacterium]|nr:hypothetical protein [Flavobacteriaceae bacterium]